jgi:cob(I)alamin adenosyltransferase
VPPWPANLTVDSRPVPLYTKTGDAGDTGLFDGTRVSKADPRVAAYGDVDELNAWLGLIRASNDNADAEVEDILTAIQKDLFALGALLADPGHRIAARVEKAALTDADVTRLERWIDRFDAQVPPLRRFILAGGGRVGAALHLSRTVCRRAERAVVALGPEAVPPVVIIYLNRLSDLLFAMARLANARAGVPETEW